MATTSMQSEARNDLISADRVKGTAVYDAERNKIGTIHDVMLNKMSGKVAYAVMSFGGFLGIGEKFHPLPWDALDYDSELGGYHVGMAGENFRDAPSFDSDSMTGDTWADDTDDYYDRAVTGGSMTYPPRTDENRGIAGKI